MCDIIVHTYGIQRIQGKLRLFDEDRSKIAGNLYKSLNKYKKLF